MKTTSGAITVTGHTAGDSMVVFLGERKTDDHRVHKNPGRTNIGFKRIAVALEAGRQAYQVELPRHISHYPNSQRLAEHMPEVAPFRYVEILGSSTITVEDVTQLALAASVYGAQYLLEGLYDAGESRYALELMTSDAKRSWLNMMRVGSTMTTEAWDEFFKPNLTWNHAWGSAPANIIPRKLIGIEPLEPAYRKVRIRPQPDGLTSADLDLPTIRGEIEARWQAADGRYNLHVRIPANTTAQVWLPGLSVDAMQEGREVLTDRADMRIEGSESGYQIVEVGAGRYAFSGPLE